MKLPVYMDYHATTPVDPRVLATMAPFFAERFGNPSSRTHCFGWEASEAVEQARSHVARLIGANPSEIYFTSGATESDNLAIQGAVAERLQQRPGIITTPIEHKAILDACKWAEGHGAEVTFLPVDRYGLIDLESLEGAADGNTVIVSIMLSNNEIGTTAPILEVSSITNRKGILLHTDAAQAIGKIPVDVKAMNVDLLSLTAHKMYGPKGTGALYVRDGVARRSLAPMLHGGGQEGSLRPGTLNVPGIVGLGEACRIAQEEMAGENARLRRLRDRLHDAIREGLDEVHLNGHPTERLPNNLNLSFGRVDGQALLASLNDVAVSTGAACNSAGSRGSYVLEAIGLPGDLIQSSIRFGLGRFTTLEEVDYAAARVIEVVRGLRQQAAQLSGRGIH